ncbi:PREDICTED: protein SMG7L-like [Ipomoea nil]|uniref:protein SMG7L-like n=1 Tax=Ipomoea nil TaxID=35883 RepID=UPI00090194B3|nr:PREDICTED: protein SMG7L-like [Ipomoea nil]XP_019175590.1 PREDICTED: protein SMG7L-like [Ipomoea nil]XP_019175594.1 PREDICTED: protein SMG7L-like [Ipomoea nil]XP_019175596.1 PREDICTED: protein SMG7L-like [Ipomoea nil]
MNTKEAASFKDQKEKLNALLEIASVEKQLLASIYSKGLLHKEVRELYHKARASYENIVLNDYKVVGLQEVEFSLWKLHYKHIDEYRKWIRQSNAEKRKSESSEEDTSSHHDIDKHTDGFKSFLAEASDFYRDLVKKLRRTCGLPGELLLRKKGDASSCLAGPTKFPQCQYACHRFLVCLGDLARYNELCKKHDACKWSDAATYYLEASWIWPDSGNPHNQLALLATYVGDPFLALYHCVRSLAVKEPFPDAWNNLMLLFEENRSSHFQSLSSEAHLDLLKPSEKALLSTRSRGSDGSSNDNSTESVSSGKSDIWRLFVRLISFFLLRSSLEDFPHTLASTVRQLEALMGLGDEDLKAALESYQFMDLSREGPYRTLQLVTIFIFIIHCLTESDEGGEVQKEDNEPEPEPESSLTKLALTATFICTGRIVERCMSNGGKLEDCPLLPAVLVFVEWLENTLERAEAHTGDERVTSAMSYFFGAFADLLNRIDLRNEEVARDNTALWEDHELKGFDPMARAHVKLDFTGHRECLDNFCRRNISRARRIFLVGTKLAGRSGDLVRNWIVFDNFGKRFSSLVAKSRDPGKENVAAEEEEVILFKPIITRHNSAPASTSRPPSSDRVSAQGTKETDESLRRASSLFVGQSQSETDTFSFHPDTTNPRLSSVLKDSSSAYPAGPPSLKAWVIDNETLSPEPFNALSITETKDPIVGSSHVSAAIHDSPPPPYVSPVPSAPLLPEDASWFKGSKEGDGILGASPMSGYPNWQATRGGPFNLVRGAPPSFLDGYSSPLQGMSSSEWLYHYRNRSNTHFWPSHFNLNAANMARYDLLDQWGNPLASSPAALYLESPQMLPGPLIPGLDEQRRDKPLFGYQRPSPYVCGTGMEVRSEQPPLLLQYLKERELQLQPEYQFRGPSFMGN